MAKKLSRFWKKNKNIIITVLVIIALVVLFQTGLLEFISQTAFSPTDSSISSSGGSIGAGGL